MQRLISILFRHLSVVIFPAFVTRANIRQNDGIGVCHFAIVFYLRHEGREIEVLCASIGRIIEAPCNLNSLLFPCTLPDFLR